VSPAAVTVHELLVKVLLLTVGDSSPVLHMAPCCHTVVETIVIIVIIAAAVSVGFFYRPLALACGNCSGVGAGDIVTLQYFLPYCCSAKSIAGLLHQRLSVSGG
jgi:hypothetical protein